MRQDSYAERTCTYTRSQALLAIDLEVDRGNFLFLAGGNAKLTHQSVDTNLTPLREHLIDYLQEPLFVMLKSQFGNVFVARLALKVASTPT